MMGWLIAFGILVLLAITPVGVYAAYNSEGISLRIIAGPARITILPKKEKKSKPIKHVQKTVHKKKTEKSERARFDDMNQIDWFPVDPYCD